MPRSSRERLETVLSVSPEIEIDQRVKSDACRGLWWTKEVAELRDSRDGGGLPVLVLINFIPQPGAIQHDYTKSVKQNGSVGQSH